MTRVVGVLGGNGGVGATTLAAALAVVGGRSLLVDLDVLGGGVDVALQIESHGGARWSGLRLAGGRLEQDDLLAGLPRWGPVAVLAADVSAVEPDAVDQVLAAAVDGPALDHVVLDLPRARCAERSAALEHCDLLVLLTRADVPGLVAAHATLTGLPPVPLGVVLRQGEVAAPDAATLVAAPLLGELPALGSAPPPLDPARLPRRLRRVAAGVLAGLGERAAAVA